MKKMKKMSEKKKKVLTLVFSGILLLSIILLPIMYTLFKEQAKASGGGHTTEGAGVLGEETFDAENPFIILEIVPQKGMGELGYLFSAFQEGTDLQYENLPISLSILTEYFKNKYPDNEEQIQKDLDSCFNTPFGAQLTWNENTDTIEAGDPFFAATAMEAFIGVTKVVTVEAGALTTYDIDNADLIYLNGGLHNEAPIKFYDELVADCPIVTDTVARKYLQVIRKKEATNDAEATIDATADASSDAIYDEMARKYAYYCPSSSADTSAYTGYVNFNTTIVEKETGAEVYSFDLSWYNTMYLYQTVMGSKKTAFIYDNKITQTINPDKNVYKLIIMCKSVSYDTFTECYANLPIDWENGASCSGKEGYITADGVFYTHEPYGNGSQTDLSGGVSAWNTPTDMFKPSFLKNVWDTEVLRYFGFSYPLIGSDYLKTNVWVYNGDKALVDSLKNLTNYADLKYKDPNSDITATEELPNYTDFKKANSTDTASIIRYILGEYDTVPKLKTKITVLEIEPAASYVYQGYSGALKVGEILGVDTSAWNEDKSSSDYYENWVEVISVSTNELNGMVNDMVSDYDMIIFGAEDKYLIQGEKITLATSKASTSTRSAVFTFTPSETAATKTLISGLNVSFNMYVKENFNVDNNVKVRVTLIAQNGAGDTVSVVKELAVNGSKFYSLNYPTTLSYTESTGLKGTSVTCAFGDDVSGLKNLSSIIVEIYDLPEDCEDTFYLDNMYAGNGVGTNSNGLVYEQYTGNNEMSTLNYHWIEGRYQADSNIVLNDTTTITMDILVAKYNSSDHYPWTQWSGTAQFQIGYYYALNQWNDATQYFDSTITVSSDTKTKWYNGQEYYVTTASIKVPSDMVINGNIKGLCAKLTENNSDKNALYAVRNIKIYDTTAIDTETFVLYSNDFSDTDEISTTKISKTLYNDTSMNGQIYMKYGDKIQVTIDNVNGGDGYARLSGNDITDKKLAEIVEASKAGIPIILSDEVYYATSQTNNFVAPNSNVYKLLDSLKVGEQVPSNVVSYTAVMENTDVKKQIRAAGNKVVAWIPDITVVAPDGKTYTPTTESQISYTEIDGNSNVAVSNYVEYDDSTGFTFYVTLNDGKLGASYDIKLLIDKNGDGLFNEDSRTDSYELLRTETVTYVAGGVTVEIPEVKIKTEGASTPINSYIPWKIEVYPTGNDALRKAVTGSFTVKESDENQKPIQVLQILPNYKNDKEKGARTLTLGNSTMTVDANLEATLTLNADPNVGEEENTFQYWINVLNSNGFRYNIMIGEMTRDQIESLCRPAGAPAYQYMNNEQKILYEQNLDTFFASFDMIIIGFADTFNSTDLDAATVKSIKRYVESGKSLMFSHDTVDYTMYNSSNSFNPTITQYFRPMVAMNRMVYDEYGNLIDNVMYSNLLIMKKQASNNQSYMFNLKYDLTERYRNNDIYKGSVNVVTNTVDQLNEGQITQFPFLIDEQIDVATTHNQWFQLDLEDTTDSTDVVVWYTLGGSLDDTYTGANMNGYYAYTLGGKDAMNNFYIYSKGNVVYTGAGHSSIGGASCRKEIQLFINTIVKAINSVNSAPVVEATNAVKGAGSDYTIYASDLTSRFTLQFVASDVDLAVGHGENPEDNAGIFKKGYVIWDVNQNGIYDEDTDKVLISYDQSDITNTRTTLYNKIGKTVIFNTTEISDGNVNVNMSAYADDAGVTMVDYMNNGELALIVQVYDSFDAVGKCTVKLVTRELFDLD